MSSPSDSSPTRAEIDQFLVFACLTYSDEDGPIRWLAASAVLTEELPAADIAVAAAACDEEALREHLRADPGAAARPTGPLGWEPLLYLAYARHDPSLTEEQTLGATRLLLDAGANPNAFWSIDNLPIPFTVVTGALGSGELGDELQPAHPHGLALARLLLESGAEVNDEQALYNRMFINNDDHLRLLCEFGLGQGSASAQLLRQQLVWACSHGFTDRVRLLVERGVDVSAPLSIGRTPWELATITGHPEIAEILEAAGAVPDEDPAVDVVRAVFSDDRAALEALPDGALEAARVAYPALILRATAAGRPTTVEILLDAGFDVDALGRADLPIDEPWETALHVAAGEGNAAITRLLLEAGADPTIRDHRFDATPAEWAENFGFDDVRAMIEEGVSVELDDEMLAQLGLGDLGSDPAGAEFIQGEVPPEEPPR
ncbi:ankyrin repeat domain-containing protein [Nakamurella silvestris]|nr:ankyrin repeat domain-containing protein [Nakamurella silvestris]